MTHIDAVLALTSLRTQKAQTVAKAHRSLREVVVQEVCAGSTHAAFASTRLSHLVYLKAYDQDLEEKIFAAEVRCLKAAIAEGLMT